MDNHDKTGGKRNEIKPAGAILLAMILGMIIVRNTLLKEKPVSSPDRLDSSVVIIPERAQQAGNGVAQEIEELLDKLSAISDVTKKPDPKDQDVNIATPGVVEGFIENQIQGR